MKAFFQSLFLVGAVAQSTLWLSSNSGLGQNQRVPEQPNQRDQRSEPTQKPLSDKERKQRIKDIDKQLEHLAELEKCLKELEECLKGGSNVDAVGPAERVVWAAERAYGTEHEETAGMLQLLGDRYKVVGQYTKAEQVYLTSLRIREKLFGKDHPKTDEAVNALAGLYADMGHHAKAEPLVRRSLKLREEVLGKDHPDSVPILRNLAIVCWSNGETAQAEALLTKCLEICEGKLGKNHLSTAEILGYLGQFHEVRKQYAKAEPLYRRQLEILEAALGKDHDTVVTALHSLAGCYKRLGQTGQAQRLDTRAAVLLEAKLAKPQLSADEVHLSKLDLASIYVELGKPEKAEPLFRYVAMVNEGKFGKDHTFTAKCLTMMALVFLDMERWHESIEFMTKSRRSLTRYGARILPVLADGEQEGLLLRLGEDFHFALSLGMLRAHDPAGAEASATWLLNSKGWIQQIRGEQQLLARDSKGGKARALVEKLGAIRGKLAALLHQQPSPGEEVQYRQQRAELQAQEHELAKALAREAGRPFRDDPWVELQEVRKRLGQDAVLVDIAHFPFYEFKNDKVLAEHYAAWITPALGKGPVRVVDLGEAEPIDAAVRALRDALQQAPAKTVARGEPESEKSVQVQLQKLGSLILQPLAKVAGKYKEWIICPEGPLWLVPWAALPLADGRYAAEQHIIRYVVSGRDLVNDYPPVKAGEPCLVADPDYDIHPSEVARSVKKILNEASTHALSPLAGKRLKGKIANWKVSFEFLKDGQLLIRDEDEGDAIAGQGSWTQTGTRLSMQTKTGARFEGELAGASVGGQRTFGGKTDEWLIDLPVAEFFAFVHEDARRGAGPPSHYLPKVPRLPSTAAEATLVVPEIKKMFKQEAKLFLGSSAAESVVKALTRPELLLLATHGYFLPNQERNNKEGSPGGILENPLLRCGLLLAGCNQRAQSKGEDEDGILTGLEILGLDLRGCKLAVLSACDTGVGDIKNGEGVAGLRQAFMLAGAESVRKPCATPSSSASRIAANASAPRTRSFGRRSP